MANNLDHPMMKAVIRAGLRPDLEEKLAAHEAGIVLGRPTPDGPVAATDDPIAAKWCEAGVKAVCDELSQVQGGSRNDATYKCSFRVGTFVAGGYLDEARAWHAVYDAASVNAHLPGHDGKPFTPDEIERVIENGFRDARSAPAELHLDPEYGDIPEAFSLAWEGLIPKPDEQRSSWDLVDLESILDGSYQPPQPGVLYRSDGQGMLYPAHVHWMHGESESGKSWVAQYATACVLRSGNRALYLDHESNAGEVVGRLLSMGVTPDQIREGFHYVQPDVSAQHAVEQFARLLENTYSLVVVDGVTDAIGLDGVDSSNNDELGRWIRRLPRRLAARTGAAVVCIDHVSKDAEGRGRFAIGGQQKLSGLDGAAYLVEPVEPLGRGVRGSLVMHVAKDRPGAVRPHCGRYNKVNRLQEAARVVIDSTEDERTSVTVKSPDVPDEGREWRPTELMERVSRVIEAFPGVSRRRIGDEVKGKAERVGEAIKFLERDGHLERSFEDNGRKSSHTIIKPYRQVPDQTGFGVSQNRNPY